MTPIDQEEVARIAAGLTEPSYDARGNSNYNPTFPGLHLCGICEHSGDIGDAFGRQPYTALMIHARNDSEALAMWLAAREVASLADRDGEDFLCDLNTAAGCIDDFSTNRQLLPRLIEAALTVRAHLQSIDGGKAS
jgi:hypothetical protein